VFILDDETLPIAPYSTTMGAAIARLSDVETGSPFASSFVIEESEIYSMINIQPIGLETLVGTGWLFNLSLDTEATLTEIISSPFLATSLIDDLNFSSSWISGNNIYLLSPTYSISGTITGTLKDQTSVVSNSDTIEIDIGSAIAITKIVANGLEFRLGSGIGTFLQVGSTLVLSTSPQWRVSNYDEIAYHFTASLNNLTPIASVGIFAIDSDYITSLEWLKHKCYLNRFPFDGTEAKAGQFIWQPNNRQAIVFLPPYVGLPLPQSNQYIPRNTISNTTTIEYDRPTS